MFLEITNRPRVIFGGKFGIASFLAIVVVNTCIGGDNINNCRQKPHMDGIRSKVMEKGAFGSQG